MKSLLYYLLQVTVASGILYTYYHLALRNKRFHQYNRFYLLAALVISIVVPFADIPVYFSHTQTDASFILQTLTSISGSATDASAPPVVYSTIAKNGWLTWQNFVYLLYVCVAATIVIRILFSLSKIRAMIRNNPVEKLEKIHFINTDEPGTPFSFFRWLFWNRQIELNSEKGEQIFRHELFHIQQRHSRDIIFMELVMIVFWINPFFYLIKKEIKAIHEFLADKFAVKENQHWQYAELLLMQALGAKQHLVNPFFHNQIKRRIAMITTSQKPGYLYVRKLMVLPIAAIVIGLFAFSYKNKEVFHQTISSEKTITIVVDAGHGGADKGALSLDKKYYEAPICLEIAQQIQKLGKEYNINVVMTRDNDYKLTQGGDNPKDILKRRVEIANKIKPDAFISIHVNADPNADQNNGVNYSGFEAYVSNKRVDAGGKLLASTILKNLAPIYETSLELKQNKENGIYILDQSSCPTVLLECGYITNSKDLAFITNKESQEKIARSILESLLIYKNSKTKVNEAAWIDKMDTMKSKTNSAIVKGNVKVMFEGNEYNLKELKIEGLDDSKIEAAEFRSSNYFGGFADSSINPLVIIDGVKQPKDSDFRNIDPATIQSVNVYKNQTGVTKYGNEGKNGVIEILTKKSNSNKTNQATLKELNQNNNNNYNKEVSQRPDLKQKKGPI